MPSANRSSETLYEYSHSSRTPAFRGAVPRSLGSYPRKHTILCWR